MKKTKRNTGKLRTVTIYKRKTVKRNKRKTVKRNKRKTVKRNKRKIMKGGTFPSALNRWKYVLDIDSILHRYESKRASKNKIKFYSYFRRELNREEIEEWSHLGIVPWVERCSDKCNYIIAQPKKKLNLIAIPYKFVTYEHNVTDEDKDLFNILSEEINKLLNKGIIDENTKKVFINAIMFSIYGTNLDDNFVSKNNHEDIDLADLLCLLNIDGFIRVVNNTEEQSIVHHINNTSELTSQYDEVAICNDDNIQYNSIQCFHSNKKKYIDGFCIF